MIKFYQHKIFYEKLRNTLESFEDVQFTDEFIVRDDFYIGYKLINRDILSNYSYSKNMIYINPKDVENKIRLNILIKQALRFRKSKYHELRCNHGKKRN